jgi:two-component system, NtrC family, response regulator AtoC
MPTKILVVDDEKLIRWTLSEALRGWSYQPIEASNVKEALDLFDAESPAVTLLDINLPDGSGLDVLKQIREKQSDAVVIMITANVLVDDTIAALRTGAYDFIGKPVNLDELQISLRNALETRELRREVRQIQKEQAGAFGFEQIIGDSTLMREMKDLARKVAASDVSSVLLQGESGTGKDLVAKAIHHASSRSRKPFIAINCAAIPGTLIESELFGYEKGAFTDAKARKEGLFEQGEGGTIFLDEIGELELSLQAKLLRVLEEGNFRRVGGLKDIPLNIRVIAASNRDLRGESEKGAFRLDLYYRLSVIQIDIPPLRDRGDDVLLLADHFIRSIDRMRPGKGPRKLSDEAAKAFTSYRWTGNVRELRNAIERAIILDENDEIGLFYMPRDISARSVSIQSDDSPKEYEEYISLPPGGIPLDTVEAILVNQAVERSGGNITKAGELLHISRDRIRYKLKKEPKSKG